jgi:GntR family transcriptional regulator
MATMSKPRMLSFQLDFRSGLPAYVQIVRQVERQAAAGRLETGDQLPTVRGLAAQLGLNFNTVARAYRSLQAAGVVTTQRGRGTYILEGRSPPAAARSGRKLLEALAEEYVAAGRRQHFSDAELSALIRRRLRSADRG